LGQKKKIMKKLISERLGVPSGIYQAAVTVYEEFIKNFIDELDESITGYQIDYNLNPPVKIEDLTIKEIKFKVEITETNKVKAPKIMGWAHHSSLKSETDDEKPEFIYHEFTGTVKLQFDLVVPENWNVEDLKIFLFENYKESISSIAHELKHQYDEFKSKKANLRVLVNYQAAKKMIGSLPPLRQLAFDLYYVANIESLVRPSQIATEMILNDIDKRQFLTFLTSTETYKELMRISQFSKENFKNSLHNYIDDIKEIFEENNVDFDEDQSDDEIVENMIKLWIKTYRNRNIELFNYLVSTNRVESVLGLSGKKLGWLKKFVKNKLDKIMSDPDKFLDKTENLFKFVSTKMMKKIAKLYDYIGEQPMKESIVDPELYGMFKNGKIFEISNIPLTEQSNTELLGRKVQINPDGSIHLENNKKNMVKLRFSIPSMNRLINIVKLIPYSGGYKIKTKMGVEKDIDNTIVKNILNFVDSDLSQTKIDTGTLTPSLGITKIK